MGWTEFYKLWKQPKWVHPDQSLLTYQPFVPDFAQCIVMDFCHSSFEVGAFRFLSTSTHSETLFLCVQHVCLQTNDPECIFHSSMWRRCRAALVLPKAEKLLRSSVQPYITSILEDLMEPTSRGFSEVREVFFRELVEISKNSLNGGGQEKLGDVSLVLVFNFFFLHT